MRIFDSSPTTCEVALATNVALMQIRAYDDLAMLGLFSFVCGCNDAAFEVATGVV